MFMTFAFILWLVSYLGMKLLALIAGTIAAIVSIIFIIMYMNHCKKIMNEFEK